MTNDTHTPPFTIADYGIDTKAHWALNPTGRLLVFVHGFNGSAGTTWLGLPEQLILQTESAGYDIVSFGYDSVEQSAGQSANDLHGFLDKLFLSSSRIINHSLDDNGSNLRRPSGWAYSHVVLVGHSLGACVARRALLNQFKAGRNKWAAQIKLVLFAPAHRGARLKLLIDAVTLAIPGGFGKSIDDAAKYFSPSLADLEKGSNFLEELLSDTESYCDAHSALKAPITFWAIRDKVVLNENFAKDVAPYEVVKGSDHISICKLACYDKRVSELIKVMSFV